MPIYQYLCTACGCEKEEFQLMADLPLTKCPECGEDKFTKVPALFDSGGLKEFSKPIVMHSVAATTPEELMDLKRKCPDIEMSMDPNDELFGVPVVKNRKEKLAVLKATGFVEKK